MTSLLLPCLVCTGVESGGRNVRVKGTASWTKVQVPRQSAEESRAMVLLSSTRYPSGPTTMWVDCCSQRTGFLCTQIHCPGMLIAPPTERGTRCNYRHGMGVWQSLGAHWNLSLGNNSDKVLQDLLPQAVLSWKRDIMHPTPIGSEVHSSGNGTTWASGLPATKA